MGGGGGGEGHVLLLGVGLHVVHVLKHSTTHTGQRRHLNLLAVTLENSRRGMTSAVDWALNNDYLSIYLSLEKSSTDHTRPAVN